MKEESQAMSSRGVEAGQAGKPSQGSAGARPCKDCGQRSGQGYGDSKGGGHQVP